MSETGIPSPIEGRIDHIGGIESITLDAERYFFGFDYESDLVLSPLIRDMHTMARFASQYMRQRDGKHDTSYWLDYLVKESTEYSELTSDEGERDFSSEQFQAIARQLEAAIEGSVLSKLEIPYHLRYLFGAATGWKSPPLASPLEQALNRLRLDPDKLFESVGKSIELLNQPQALPKGSLPVDAALVIQKYLDFMIHTMPANWSGMFSLLASHRAA